MDFDVQKKKLSKRKKVIVLGIGTFFLSSAAFVAWPTVFKKNHFERIVQEDGDIELVGTEDYATVKDYDVLQVQTIIGNEEILLADSKYKMYDNDFGVFGYVYEDVITGKQICRLNGAAQENTIVLNSERLQDYLIAFDKVKAFYTPEDIEEILTLLGEYYENNAEEFEKTLVKE